MNLQIIDFENLMDGAVRAGATDVHITVGKVPRLRVDRKLVMGACHNIMERDTVLGVIEYVLSQLKGEEAAKRRAAWDSKRTLTARLPTSPWCGCASIYLELKKESPLRSELCSLGVFLLLKLEYRFRRSNFAMQKEVFPGERRDGIR